MYFDEGWRPAVDTMLRDRARERVRERIEDRLGVSLHNNLPAVSLKAEMLN